MGTMIFLINLIIHNQEFRKNSDDNEFHILIFITLIRKQPRFVLNVADLPYFHVSTVGQNWASLRQFNGGIV